MIDNLQSEPVPNNSGIKSKKSALAYFYCSYNENDRHDPESILRTLVKQLCLMAPDGEFPELVSSIYRSRKDSGQLTLGECSGILLNLLNGFSQTTIVIDALDECNPSTRKLLLDTLGGLLLASPHIVKIFVASRDDDDLTRILAQFPGVQIGVNDNAQDMERYIDSQIEARITGNEFRIGKADPKLKAFIISALRKKACGM